ncbi:MAG TPA: LysR family transcriptional regulator [Roseiarcus sp.]|nr:LysR family transcriptional regulator [Roseiarcus sp.]
MRRAPNLMSVEAFLAAAELGSFKAAADRLCLTAPAITRRIQALERHSGRSLFDRGAGASS